MFSSPLVRLSTIVAAVVLAGMAGLTPSRAQPSPSSAVVPRSSNLMPHFETVRGRPVFFVDGWPHTILTVEIPWIDLVYGRYDETLNSYDDLYPAAKAMGLNALKVPIKWSMVEPRKGEYDFSYPEHVKRMAERNGLKLVLGWFGHYASGDGNIYRNLTGEIFAPMDVIEDAETYPRAVDADGVVHHNSASYDDPAIIRREFAAFRAFLEHLRKIDAETRTVLMVQVENEIAVFGADRQNRKMWRDHSPASNRRFREKGFTDDLKYSAWNLSANWIRPLTDAGAAAYPLPFFLNFVGGKLADWMVGGAPGEDVATYLENCPQLTFVGLNLYLPGESSVNDLRQALDAYRVGRNLPSITETNSGPDPLAPRLAYLSVGEFGSPIFAPWALNISYPTPYKPYVLPDGTLAHGAFALRDAYTSLAMALPQVSTYAATDKLKVFMARFPGERFSQTQDVAGAKVTVSGEDNGQGIIIRPAANEFILIGYRCHVSIWDQERFVWPALKKVRVERGRFVGDVWEKEGDLGFYGFNQSARTLGVQLATPQVVRIWWEDTPR